MASTMRDYNAGGNQSRSSVWKMLNEAWGWMTGGLISADITITNPRIKEGQIRFVENGHSHNGTTGTNLSATAIHNRAFNLNACNVAWGNYFYDNIFKSGATNYDFAVLGGAGVVGMAASITSGSVTSYTGSTAIQYDPGFAWTAAHSCKLDLFGINTAATYGNYDTAFGTAVTQGSTWSVLGFWLSPRAGAMASYVYNYQWYQYGGAMTVTGYCTTGGNAASTFSFDYFVAIRKL